MSDNNTLQSFPTLWDLLRSLRKYKHPIKLVWIGLDNVGKTSLIKRLKTGEFFDNTPRTMGLTVDKLFYEADSNLEIISWDLGGQIYFRENLWNEYLKGASAIIFVLDISDTSDERFEESKTELWKYVLGSKEVVNSIPLLIMANKFDLQPHIYKNDLKKKLELDKIPSAQIEVFNVSAFSGLNVERSFIWLFKSLLEKKKETKKKSSKKR